MDKEKKINWEDLTEEQKTDMKSQYIHIRACEDEITEEKAKKIYSTDDKLMAEHSYYLTSNGLFINI